MDTFGGGPCRRGWTPTSPPLARLEVARGELLEGVDALTDDALERARRGGWSVRRVLQHLIESEWHYARLVARLRGLPAPPSVEERELPASVTEAVRMLTASRRALIAALEDINEASFYRLGTVGREEYSVLSVLENAAHHDREHAQQIQIATAS